MEPMKVGMAVASIITVMAIFASMLILSGRFVFIT
jgi:hypothetical protein